MISLNTWTVDKTVIALNTWANERPLYHQFMHTQPAPVMAKVHGHFECVVSHKVHRHLRACMITPNA
jgi:hypothetical protein